MRLDFQLVSLTPKVAPEVQNGMIKKGHLCGLELYSKGQGPL